jgi:tetratricopeptide (TPR) repeat protein
MIRTAFVVTLLSAGMAGQAQAQAVIQNQTVSRAMFAQTGRKYVPAKCSADKNKHFKVSSGTTYLSSAISTASAEQVPAVLNNGKTVVLEAIKDEGQVNAPSAWFALGRIYLFQGDVVGADSALRKAEALAPDCAEEIRGLRRTAYAPVANEAVQAIQAGDTAAALTGFRTASVLYPTSAFAPYNLGSIYSQRNPDSAIAYFKAAASVTPFDSTEAKIARQAQYNLGVMQLNAGKVADAASTFEAYVQANPGDENAKLALARAYRAAGQADKARALDAQTGTTSASGPVADADLGAAFEAYKAKDYAKAAELFEKVIAREPDNVAALQSQAVSYLALKDGPRLAKAAGRLSELEPMNRYALEMVRESWRLQKDPAKATAAAEKILGLRTGVVVTGLSLGAASATLTGTATGFEALDPKSGKALAPAPATLTFEMLDKGGAVVASQDVSIPALAKDATHDFTVEARGEGIVNYRYRVKA